MKKLPLGKCSAGVSGS